MDIAALSSYDFLDFGCSKGGNIKFTESVLQGRRGLGIDTDRRKIEIARLDGCNAVEFNILDLPDEKTVDFVTMAHFLEHIPSVREAADFLIKGVKGSRRFVHVRQPFFDADGYLMSKGLKLYWSDWKGHRNAMSALDAYKTCRDLLSRDLIQSFAILGRGPIIDATHDAVIPLAAPFDSQKYTHSMGLKLDVTFSVPIFQELVIDIVIDQSEDRGLLLRKLHQKMPMAVLFASENHSLPF